MAGAMGVRDTAGWRHLTASGQVARGPVALHSLVVLVATAGKLATVTDSPDGSAGRTICAVTSTANLSTPVSFPRPLLCEHGIYVTFETGVTSVTVTYTPVVRDGVAASPAS